MSALPDTLSFRHALLAIAVMAVWGINFVVIRVGLNELPPLLFATLRFAFALFPAVLFLRRPAVAWSNLAAYGLLIGGGLFGLLYIGMNGHITPGLASLVVQAQVFFTIALAAYLNAERVRPFHIVALIVAVGGLAVIAMHTDGSTTALGLAQQHPDRIDRAIVCDSPCMSTPASAKQWEERIQIAETMMGK